MESTSGILDCQLIIDGTFLIQKIDKSIALHKIKIIIFKKHDEQQSSLAKRN